MAAKAMLSTHAVATSLPQYNGLMSTSNSLAMPRPRLATVPSVSGKGKRALGVRCDFIGSPTNLIMVTTTTLMLFAGRFGLAPSANRKASAGLKLQDRDSGLQTGDPAGFTGTDTLACGALGHIMGVGVVLGLKYVGVI
uniref:PSI-K n=1 Tax=Araucaria cunninghamii TaxID=56994 RepID=A0A0D6QRN3_ARACU